MMESGFYPPGAEYDSDAPWNESSPSDEYVCEKAECSVCVTLEKTQNVEAWINEDESIDDVSWRKQYLANNITITDLLGELQQYIKKDLAKALPETSEHKHLCKLLEASKGWNLVEYEVDQL